MRVASSTMPSFHSPERVRAWKSMAMSAAVPAMEWLGSPPASTSALARYHGPHGSTSSSALVRSVTQQLPHHTGDDRPTDGLEDVARIGRRIAVRLERHELPRVRDRDLR